LNNKHWLGNAGHALLDAEHGRFPSSGMAFNAMPDDVAVGALAASKIQSFVW
jgi:hypothetical protein